MLGSGPAACSFSRCESSLSYVDGEVLAADGGFQGATHTGRQQPDRADMIMGA